MMNNERIASPLVNGDDANMQPPALSTRSVKHVPSVDPAHDRARRRRVATDLRKDARSRLISAKRAKDIPHAFDTMLQQSADEMMEALQNPAKQMAALKSLRHKLEKSADSVWIGPLFSIVQSSRNQEVDASVVEEALWCLNVFAHGYDSLLLVDSASLLVDHVSRRLPGCMAAMWTIANLAADNPSSRRKLRSIGAIEAVSGVLGDEKCTIEPARIAAWTLCNLVRGHNDPAELDAIMKSSVPDIVLKVAKKSLVAGHCQILAECLWTFTYLTAADPQHVRSLLHAELAPILVGSLALSGALDDRSITDSRLAALRTCGNVASGPDDLSEVLLQQRKFLPELLRCLTDAHPALVKEAAWTVANISGGSPDHAIAIVDAGFLPFVVQLFAGSLFDVKREAGFALYNLARIDMYFRRIWEMDVLPGFLDLIRSRDGEAAELGFMFVKLTLQSLPADEAISALRDNEAQEILEDLRLVREDLQPDANALIDRYLDTGDEEMARDNDAIQRPVEYPPWRLGAHSNK